MGGLERGQVGEKWGQPLRPLARWGRWGAQSLRSRDIPPALVGLMAIAAVALFVASSVRHFLLQSTAFDLAIYDQVAYLASRGLTPYATVSDMHHMGNHAAYSFYLVAPFYRLWPDVHWLFALQAVGLALGALPVWAIARQARLDWGQAWAMAIAYGLYPVVFNVNLFDFHPEVLGIAALLGCIWAARAGRVGWFTLGLVYVLGCKAVLSITVASMGLWLLLLEGRRRCGAIALALGTGWFLAVTQGVIPAFNGGEGHDAIGRYAYLGESVTEAFINLFLRPDLVLGRLLSIETAVYLALLAGPLLWWLLPGRLGPLVAAAPAIALNCLSTVGEQRDLVHQYSLPILPFLLTAAIANLQHPYPWPWADRPVGQWLQRTLQPHLANGRLIVVWSAIGFLALAKFGYFGSLYLTNLDTWGASRTAIAQIQQDGGRGGVLTTATLAPHLSHRVMIRQTIADRTEAGYVRYPQWEEYDFVLLDTIHPGWNSTPEFSELLRVDLSQRADFRLTFAQDGVYLFQRRPDA